MSEFKKFWIKKSVPEQIENWALQQFKHSGLSLEECQSKAVQEWSERYDKDDIIKAVRSAYISYSNSKR